MVGLVAGLMLLQVLQALDPWLLFNRPRSRELSDGRSKRNWQQSEGKQVMEDIGGDDDGMDRQLKEDTRREEEMQDESLLESLRSYNGEFCVSSC